MASDNFTYITSHMNNLGEQYEKDPKRFISLLFELLNWSPQFKSFLIARFMMATVPQLLLLSLIDASSKKVQDRITVVLSKIMKSFMALHDGEVNSVTDIVDNMKEIQNLVEEFPPLEPDDVGSEEASFLTLVTREAILNVSDYSVLTRSLGIIANVAVSSFRSYIKEDLPPEEKDRMMEIASLFLSGAEGPLLRPCKVIAAGAPIQESTPSLVKASDSDFSRFTTNEGMLGEYTLKLGRPLPDASEGNFHCPEIHPSYEEIPGDFLIGFLGESTLTTLRDEDGFPVWGTDNTSPSDHFHLSVSIDPELE